MNEVIVDNYALVPERKPYVPPEAQMPRLNGRLYGHPDKEDGKYCFTSDPVILCDDGKSFISISGRKYILKNIDPEYAKQFLSTSVAERFVIDYINYRISQRQERRPEEFENGVWIKNRKIHHRKYKDD